MTLGCMVAMSFGACHRPVVFEPLDRGANESIVEYHKAVVSADHKDYALYELQRGLLFFDLGDYKDADERFANACRVAQQISGDEDREKAAVLWTESSKTYRGEPYERATAFFYRGLCRFKLGDYSGALAAFRSSLACDAETRTKEQKYLEDFSISHFMAAMCYLRMGERDNADAALSLARTYAPENAYLDSNQLSKNFVALIAVGNGPFLRSSPWDRSIKQIDCLPSIEAKIEVEIDGGPAGEAALVTDLLDQAKSQDRGEMDSVRMGKSIVKQVVSHAPYASLASHLVRSEADLRCWATLPRQYYIVAMQVPAGKHTVAVRFRDSSGQELVWHNQAWFDVPVSASVGELFCFRSGADSPSQRQERPFQTAQAPAPTPVFCFDGVGHIAGSKPFILGGTCCCTPTQELMDAYHADGILADMTLQDLVKLYEDRGIKTALDHQGCNNLCEFGPHVVKGGKCMVPPVPGTANFEEVRFGKQHVPVENALKQELQSGIMSQEDRRVMP